MIIPEGRDAGGRRQSHSRKGDAEQRPIGRISGDVECDGAPDRMADEDDSRSVQIALKPDLANCRLQQVGVARNSTISLGPPRAFAIAWTINAHPSAQTGARPGAHSKP